MKFSLYLLVAFSLFLTLSVQAQTDPVLQKIVEIGQTDNQVMDHLDILCNRFYAGQEVRTVAGQNITVQRCNGSLFLRHSRCESIC